jgi:flagellar hook-length control protein FliK
MNPIAAALSAQPSAPPASNLAPADEGRSAEFARCLDRARDGDTAPDREASSRPAARPLADGRNPSKASNARRNDADAPAKAPKEAPQEAPPKDATDAANDAAADASEGSGEDAAAPDLAALLPGWSPPAAAVAAVVPAQVPAAAAAMTPGAQAVDSADALPDMSADSTATLTPNTKARLSSPAAGDGDAARPAAALEAPPTHSGAPTATLPSSAELQAVAGENKETKVGTSAAQATMPAAGALPVASATPAGGALKAGEMLAPTATVAAPIETPQFAPSLATHVRWWAQQGVQQAQLLLNPAEMGPVAVKILLDGRDARIDFSADLAATRGAIEAALPVLAAALDDSGLKLSGGGVHDGSAQRQPGWNARGTTQRSAVGSAAREGAASIGPAARTGGGARGLVDLVA